MRHLAKISIAVAAITICAGMLWVALFYMDTLRGLSWAIKKPPQDNAGRVPVFTETAPQGDEGGFEPVVVAENLSIPWDIAFLPEGGMLVTERSGRLMLFAGETDSAITIPGVAHAGEGGLLGIALHPDFSKNSFVYLYFTASSEAGVVNRVMRYEFRDGELLEGRAIIDDIPGAQYHDGGRIRFGPDKLLYITTGDAGNPQNAQNTDSLAGKILRVHDDGSIPSDNPFGNAVWSYGHRNPQGLTRDDAGRLWSTEHGRSGLASGFDELNLIEKGKNYGWSQSQGDSVAEGTIGPVLHSGASTTWAPASALYWDGSIFFAGLAGEALYEAVLDGEAVIELKEHFAGTYGRLRTVVLGPDGMFYLTTSNQDGRGSPAPADDRIIRIDPARFR
ncbi:MAG: PQQ-dependent sugar dehydrogenase [Patescibacteria group bacterium]|nr:PQQ-dependent sugar dehydrogenase [Patescibacteria group bacterium]